MIEILDVTLCRTSSALHGFNIEAPERGTNVAEDAFTISGWVLGKATSVAAVELISAGRLYQTIRPTHQRPDLLKAFPTIPEAEFGGFRGDVVIRATGLSDIVVQARLRDGFCAILGVIRAYADISPSETLIVNPIQDKECLKLVPRNACAQRGSAGKPRFGNLRRVTPISNTFGFNRGNPVDRFYVERFLAAQSTHIHGRVLEIADNAYTKRFGGSRVEISDVLHPDESNANATVVADLACADHIPSNTFDCVILTQTLHLIYDMRAALTTLHRILKPRGVLLATFPGITQLETEETWHWRFTSYSAANLFHEAFPGGDVSVEAFGNVFSALAFLYGAACGELKSEELETNDPDFEVIITVCARRMTPLNLLSSN